MTFQDPPSPPATTVGQVSSAPLTVRQKLTFIAHLWKAVTQQHHRELRPLLRKYIPNDGVVIDVGAHAGQFAKLFAGIATRGHVYAVEPGIYARMVLTKVLAWRRLHNVTLIDEGLSDTVSINELNVPIKARGDVGFGLAHLGADTSGRAIRRESIRLTTLDRLQERLVLKRLDFIKADIEGWELHMLRGGIATLARFHPTLMLEIVANQLARAGNRPEEVWETLKPLGYQAFRLDDDKTPVNEFSGDADYVFVAANTHKQRLETPSH